MMKLIYKLGEKIRNPSLSKKYDFLKKTEKYTINELEKLQLMKLKKLLNEANKTEFYRQKFKNNNIKISEFNSIKDMVKLPIISKKDLMMNSNNIQQTKGFKKLFYSETSGSSGEALEFYRNEEWDSSNRAAQKRGYSWYGIDPSDKNGYLWGYNFSFFKKIKTKISDKLVNRFRLFNYEERNLLNFILKCKKADYLEGYSSMIYEVAKLANKKEISLANLKMVKGTSEQIKESYQEEALKAFGTKIISEYGAAEAGIIAFECPSGNMHITMENVIVEEINNEILITNLDSHSFPIIRYKLGDYVEIDKQTKCDCGLEHYIIKEVKGRTGSVIYGFIEKYPSLTLYYVFKNLASKGILLNYQAIQRNKGELELRLSKELNDDELKTLNQEIIKYYKNDLRVKIKYEDFIRSQNNKLKSFISEL